MNPSIFRAYDIRGIYPGELDEKTAYQIGRAFAVYLLETEAEKPEKIIIGSDARLSSPALSQSFAEGAADEGVDIINIGLVTVDAVYFASARWHLPAVMVTASHNPKEYNGFKLMKKNVVMIGVDSGLENIKNIIPAQTAGIRRGEAANENINSDFLKHVLNFVDFDYIMPMRIAIDASSGAAGPILKRVLEKLSMEYTPLNFEPDGNFLSHEPDPTVESNILDLKSEVKNGHYHFGCAFDGDGDRIVFVDENGKAVNPSIIGAMMAKYFLKQNPKNKIVYGATVSQIVSDTVNLYGGEAIRERIGHTFIQRRLREEGGILGIETSGHYYFRKNFYADSAIIGFLVMVDILSKERKSLSVLVKEFSRYVSIPETNFKIENPEEFIKKIAQNFEGYEIDWLDGLTARTSDFWLNLRLSNTEPLLRLNIEAKDELILGRVKNNLLALIEKLKQ